MNDTGDSVTSKTIRRVNKAQRLADEWLLGDDRYTELVLWDDGDFRVEVFHGFDSPKSVYSHGERISYKESDGDFTYEIVVNRVDKRGLSILKSKEIT